MKGPKESFHHQFYLFWSHPTLHHGLLLLLSLPAERQQEGSSLTNFLCVPTVCKRASIPVKTLLLSGSHPFLPAEIDTKGNQPVCCRETSVRGMRGQPLLLVNTLSLHLAHTLLISWLTTMDTMGNEQRKVKRGDTDGKILPEFLVFAALRLMQGMGDGSQTTKWQHHIMVKSQMTWDRTLFLPLAGITEPF